MVSLSIEWPQDLLSFLTVLARWVNYDFDDSDWDAIRFGLFQRLGDPDVGEETFIEYNYSFAGDVEVRMNLRWSPYPDWPGWIGVRLEGLDSALAAKATGASDALNERSERFESAEYLATGKIPDPIREVRKLLST